jgi:hypothetical protein
MVLRIVVPGCQCEFESTLRELPSDSRRLEVSVVLFDSFSLFGKPEIVRPP